MTYGLLLILVIVILLVLVIRRQPRPIASLSGLGKWLFYIALLLIGLYCGFNLMFAIGEMAGGDMSGASHLLPAAALMLMIWLAWRRPCETGVGLIVVGILASSFFIINSWGRWGDSAMPVIFGGLPFLVPGILLVLAVRKSSLNP